jgi:outer membrane biosynthesis protein TonB
MFRATNPRHREEPGEDERSMLVLKIAAVVVLSGIGIGFLSLAVSSGGGDEAAVTDPAVPTITDAGGPETTSEEHVPAPPQAATLPAPAVGTETAVISPKPKPKPTARPDKPGRDNRKARINRPCSREGAVAFTKRLEPLMCRNGRWDLLL